MGASTGGSMTTHLTTSGHPPTRHPPPRHAQSRARHPGTTRSPARHIGPSPDEQAKMLAVVGYGSLDDLVRAALPDSIRSDAPLAVPAAASEADVLTELREHRRVEPGHDLDDRARLA